ncbi:AhpC-TSA-domain-containing protein [Saccharata proteae CBS 121410]|uniref:thioredoxin-dependent peroxiredoxin n=1 Tax=Saccharata proteae CBS 121410 TaxID=1314787 RepID=A0A9P4HUV6_9PEZI|nr:AhpC-TSA-domain-containing protein [Saccharata proteae CBS 121410]
MVELRKRKTPPPAPEKAAKKKPGPKAGSKVAKAKEAVEETANTAADKVMEGVEAVSNGKTVDPGKPTVGKTIELDTFGGEVETHDGEKVTLKKLVEDSKAGVVLFTYPKASTPGCTKQACLFRDSYEPLTTTGLSIYGLSNDSPKANTTFKTKQNLPYPLLCDPAQSLIKAIGLAKAPKGTTRGVFVVDKQGKILAAEAGGPDATVEVVKKLVESKGDSSAVEKVEEAGEKNTEKSDKAQADVAGEVADSAEKLDGTPK